jgi:hypothetical protein
MTANEAVEDVFSYFNRIAKNRGSLRPAPIGRFDPFPHSTYECLLHNCQSFNLVHVKYRRWHAVVIHVAILPARKRPVEHRKISAPDSCLSRHATFDPSSHSVFLSMAVPMVSVWKVRMRMCQRLMPVQMVMLGAGCDRNIVIVLVMLFVDMFMIVHHLSMGMLMLMTLS